VLVVWGFLKVFRVRGGFGSERGYGVVGRLGVCVGGGEAGVGYGGGGFLVGEVVCGG